MLTDFRLKVFCTVALRKSFTKAAKELNISQPAVSQNIAELEQQIGATIIERAPGLFSLTPKGEILFDYAQRILHLYDNLSRELLPQITNGRTLLRLAACPIAARYILPPIIKKFGNLYPHIEISMIERDSFEIEGIINDSYADLGVMETYPEKLHSAPLAQIALSQSGESVKEILFAYPENSPLIKEINTFILTSKTHI